MAAGFSTQQSGLKRKRGRDDCSWTCDIHDKPVTSYCSDDKIALCHLCVFLEHHKPCSVRNIEEVIMEFKEEAQKRTDNIKQAKVTLRDFDSKVAECKQFITDHMNALKADVHTRFDGEIKAIGDKQREKESAINEKAEEQIKIINQRREEHIKQSAEEAEQQRAPLRDQRSELLGDVDRIAAKAVHYIDQLKEKSTAISHFIKDSEEKIRRLHKSDSELVNFAAPVFEAVDKTLQGISNEDDVACVGRAVRAVRRVTCSVSNVNGTFRGRIDTGEWERVDTIGPESCIRVAGSVSDNEIGVTVSRRVNGRKCDVLSIINVKTHQETACIIPEEGSVILSCAAVSSELIVCGKGIGEGCEAEGDHLTGLVSLYDRRGQLVRDMTIPRHSTFTVKYLCVFVDVDGDGMVVAAQDNQQHIYVLNPSDGAIVRSVTLPGGREVWFGGISSLRDSSGDVVVCTGFGQYSIVSQSGSVKATIRDGEWGWGAQCSVDMVTGALYVAYRDIRRGVGRVDRCTREGVIAERGVVEYPHKDPRRSMFVRSVAITPTGKLVVFDGIGRIFIFKPSFNLTRP